MKVYFLSLLAGVAVGIFYSAVGIRSPAPPVVALIGLLGILAGEQIPPLARAIWQKEPHSSIQPLAHNRRGNSGSSKINAGFLFLEGLGHLYP